ncbi:MAG: hypothetical protein Q8S21_06180 [Candidatus Paracaedibacteraceae bacterium]|nr:hypothetical protein [Candidatus Paracaedibacteraceae bacterium]
MLIKKLNNIIIIYHRMLPNVWKPLIHGIFALLLCAKSSNSMDSIMTGDSEMLGERNARAVDILKGSICFLKSLEECIAKMKKCVPEIKNTLSDAQSNPLKAQYKSLLNEVDCLTYSWQGDELKQFCNQGVINLKDLSLLNMLGAIKDEPDRKTTQKLSIANTYILEPREKTTHNDKVTQRLENALELIVKGKNELERCIKIINNNGSVKV